MAKKSFLGFVGTALAIGLMFSGMGASVTAFADEEKTVQSVRYNAYEAIVAGEPVQTQAEVTFTDGSTEMRPIHYSEFPVNRMHDLFRDFNAVGSVEGSNDVIRQTFVVMPANVEYMINLGSNLTQTDYEYTGEGVLGKILDPTGESSVSDPFNEAILRKFPEMRNKTGAKQYGQGDHGEAGDWGYEGSNLVTQKVDGSAANTGRNLFKHLVFPKRGTKDFSVKLALDGEAVEYDLYLGFYSYWFARRIDIDLNGEAIASGYSVSPSENVFSVSGKSLQGETILNFKANDRSDAYSQALASFVCVTKADKTEYQTPSAPTAPESLELTDTQLEVSGLTPDTVLQLYDYDKLNLLYEHRVGAEETTYTVSLEELNLTGVSRIGVCCSNVKGMGEAAMVRRTDVENFTVSYETAFVGKDLAVDLSAHAQSGIVSLKVYDGEEVVIEKQADRAVNWSEQIYLTKNGDYRFEVESGEGGKGIEERSITNIDNIPPSLAFTFDMTTAKASTNKSFVLGVTPASVSPVAETGYIFRGAAQAVDFSNGTVSFGRSGDYTVYFVNELGKTGVCKTNVAMKPSDSVTAVITEDTTKRFKQICFTGGNGYEIASVNVYGNIKDETEKMIVNGGENDFNFSVYRDGVYFAQVVTKDGVCEYIVIDTTGAQAGEGTASGNNAALIAVSVVGGVVLVAGTVAIVLLLKKPKKNKETSEQSENK